MMFRISVREQSALSERRHAWTPLNWLIILLAMTPLYKLGAQIDSLEALQTIIPVKPDKDIRNITSDSFLDQTSCSEPVGIKRS